METTTFLAQLWGPVILAVGIGVFTSRSYYTRVYRELDKETLAVLLFAMVAITAGIAQIMHHNVWRTFPEIVISLLGWGLLLKGVAFAIAPKLVDKAGDWQADSKLIPSAAGFMIILGAYLCSIGYFM